MATEQFSLCWDNFHKNMSSGMHSLLESEDLVDVTLAVEGRYLKAHKMVLSVCSPYFRELFKANPCKHPIVFMKDVSYTALSDLLQFMYQGEVQVNQEHLGTFIKTAEALQIKGLTGDNANTDGLLDDDSKKPNPESGQKRTIDSDEFKVTTTLVKRTPGPASKKARVSHMSSNKAEVTSTPEVHLKVEPYETSDNGSAEQNDEDGNNYDSGDRGDDQEDYSLIEGNVDDPQAGTSTEGSGEGQDDVKYAPTSLCSKRREDVPRFIIDGFVFHINIIKGNPRMIYLRCLEYKRLGCHARAVIPCDGTVDDVKVNKPHNHPPDNAAEEKIIFLRELKQIMMTNPDFSSREVYEMLSKLYPLAAAETPFETIQPKLNRWRKCHLPSSA